MDRSQALGIILGFALLAFLIYKLYADRAEEKDTTDAEKKNQKRRKIIICLLKHVLCLSSQYQVKL